MSFAYNVSKSYSSSILFSLRYNSYSSFIFAKYDLVFALEAFVVIPLLPVKVDIVTPANINITIIVTANAISVTPFLFFSFFICSPILLSIFSIYYFTITIINFQDFNKIIISFF